MTMSCPPRTWTLAQGQPRPPSLLAVAIRVRFLLAVVRPLLGVSGQYGRLGLGNTDDIGDNESPTVNINLGGATATAVTAAGSEYVCAS